MEGQFQFGGAFGIIAKLKGKTPDAAPLENPVFLPSALLFLPIDFCMREGLLINSGIILCLRILWEEIQEKSWRGIRREFVLTACLNDGQRESCNVSRTEMLSITIPLRTSEVIDFKLQASTDFGTNKTLAPNILSFHLSDNLRFFQAAIGHNYDTMIQPDHTSFSIHLLKR